MKKTIKKNQPKAHLRSLISDEPVVDEENRTIELTWSTGFKGLRSDWGGQYYEELSMKPEHVDMSRLQSGAPLLDVHQSWSNSSVIGVVERAWLEGDKGKALVRFSKDADADKIFQKVKEKILRNVSVGYQVRKYEDVTPKGDKIPVYRATNWQPHEISIVPIGFDPNAQIRSQELLTEVEIETNEEEVITPSESSKEKSAMTEQEKRELELAAKKQAALEEKQRQTEIRALVRSAKLEESVADELCKQDITVDEARKQVFERMVAAQQPTSIESTVRVETSDENATKRREGFEQSLLHRINSANFKMTEDAKPYYGKSVLRQIEHMIPRHSMESDAQYAKRAMSSSDLPLALANVAEKGLQKQYELQPRTFSRWTRSDTLNNYKEFSQVKAGDRASLLERKENAPATESSFGEDKEVAQLKDYSRIVSFSSQMLVNDDLGVIARIANSGGISVARLENKEAYKALITNKTMNDGTVLYHANHGNLGSAGAISETTVAEAYKLMRKQMTTDKVDPLNLAPKFFICGPDKEVEARKFFASIIPNQTSNVNIFQGSMEVIVDAELTGNQYYLLADPSLIDTVVCYRLAGQEQPKIDSRVKFETSSLQLKIDHAFAASMMDWRGVVKNAGN